MDANRRMRELLGEVDRSSILTLVLPDRLAAVIEAGWRKGNLDSTILGYYEKSAIRPPLKGQEATDYELFINGIYIDDPDGRGPVFPEFEELSDSDWQRAMTVPALAVIRRLLDGVQSLLHGKTMIAVLTIGDRTNGAKLRLYVDRGDMQYVHMSQVEFSETAYLIIKNDEVI